MARCKDVECNKQCPKGVPWCAPHREGKILTSAQQAALDQVRADLPAVSYTDAIDSLANTTPRRLQLASKPASANKAAGETLSLADGAGNAMTKYVNLIPALIDADTPPQSNEYRNEFRSDRREDGVCREGPCGKPVHPNSPFCTEHRAAELVRTNARYELYKQAQLCITPGCSKPLEDDETAVRCSDCRQHRREVSKLSLL